MPAESPFADQLWLVLSRSLGPKKTSWRKSNYKAAHSKSSTIWAMLFWSHLLSLLYSHLLLLTYSSPKYSFGYTRGFICSMIPYFEGSSLVFSHYTYCFLHSPVELKLALPRRCWQLPHTVNSNFSKILRPWLSEPFLWYLSSTFWHFLCGLHSYLIFYVWISFHLC